MNFEKEASMLKCGWCQIKYEKARNVKHKHRDYCSFSCKESAIDADAQVNGASVINGTYDDNPGRDLFDWAWGTSRLT